MSIVRKVVSKLNYIFALKSHWYNNVMFADCRKFWNHNVYNLEVVNLGSSSALNGFCYSDFDVKAANWAMAPQSFVGDYAILTNYCSYLKPGATVIIPLCPFSSLGGGNDDLSDKYYSVVRPISIPYASLRRRNNIMNIKAKPLKYIPLYSILGDVKSLILSGSSHSCDNFEEDANKWIHSWMKEFSLYNLENPLALINRDRFTDSVLALQNLLIFCNEHKYNAVLVIPPMTKHLSQKLSIPFRKQFIFDFIKQSNVTNVPVYDYIDYPELCDDKFFLNSYMLNRNGAKAFTKQVLSDLQ